jgi:hypothetical protein
MRDVEGIEDARRTCGRHDQRPWLAMGTKPDDGTDNRQRNKSFKDINQRALKLPQRTQAERSANGGKEGQAASGCCGESAKNGANGTDLIKVKFHGP